MKKTTICKYEKDIHDIPSSVLVELAKALLTTPNYLLLGDVEADDWMDDMIQMLEKIRRPEMKELAKKQITLLCIFRSSGKLIPLKTVSPFPDVR